MKNKITTVAVSFSSHLPLEKKEANACNENKIVPKCFQMPSHANHHHNPENPVTVRRQFAAKVSRRNMRCKLVKQLP